MSWKGMVAMGTSTIFAKVYTIEIVIGISWVMFGEIGTNSFVLEPRPWEVVREPTAIYQCAALKQL